MKYKCSICGSDFTSYNSNPQFCSKKCKALSQIANVSFTDAKTLYELGISQVEVAERLNTTQKIITNLFRRNGYLSRKPAKRNQFGQKNHMWKGRNASYTAFHYRLKSKYGKPKKCDICGTSDPSKTYDWANLTGNYEDENDYIRMCRSCHWKYDKTHLNFKGAVGGRRGVILNACVESS